MYPAHELRQRMLSLFRVFALLSLATLASPAFAQEQAWDQAEVSRLASALPSITGKLYARIYEQQQTFQMPIGFDQSGDRYAEFKDSIRLMHSEAIELVAQLKSGKGRTSTRPIVKRLAEESDDAGEYAASQFATNPVNEDLAALDKALKQLDVYYQVESQLRP